MDIKCMGGKDCSMSKAVLGILKKGPGLSREFRFICLLLTPIVMCGTGQGGELTTHFDF